MPVCYYIILGECHCDLGFGADDCSVNMTEPLKIYFIGQKSAVCDRDTRLCLKTPINARNFVLGTKLTCKIEFRQITQVLARVKVFQLN